MAAPFLFDAWGKGAGSTFVVPTGMPTLPILPRRIISPGVVETDIDAVAACYIANAARITAGETWVSTTGNDTTGNGSFANPYATLTKAARTTLGPSVITARGGTYDVFFMNDAQVSQGGGAKLTHIRPAPGETVRIKTPGDSLTGKTFTLVGNGVYKTAIASLNNVFNVTRSDIEDEWDYPSRFHYYATVDELLATGSGFFWDTVARELYLAWPGYNINSIAEVLTAYYQLPVTDRSQISNQNTPLLFDAAEGDLILDGVNLNCETRAQAPDIFQTQLWMQGVTQQFCNTVGIQAAGTYLVTYDNAIHATNSDNILYDLTSDLGILIYSFGQEVNNVCTMAGDRQSGRNTVDNCNGSSAHVGDICRLGGLYAQSFGGLFVDRADVDNHPFYEWCVGSVTQGSTDLTGGRGWGFAYQVVGGTNQVRNVWLDTCSSSDQPVADLQTTLTGSGSSLNVKLFNCDLPVQSQSGNSTVSSYNRSSPG